MTLADLGIDAEAEHLYRLVLRSHGHSEHALADAAGLPVAQVRVQLEKLVALGLLRQYADAEPSATWVPVDPALAIDDLIERLQDDLMSRQRRVARARTAVTELVQERDAGRGSSEPEVRRLSGVDDVRGYLEELAFYTRNSVWSILPDGAQRPEALAASLPLDLRALRRGVDMRTLYDPAILGDEDSVAYIRQMVSRGAAARLSPRLPERLVLVDGTTAVIPVDPADVSRGAVVVTHSRLVLGFIELFNGLWSAASPLEPGQQEAVDELTEVERQLLTLLCRGVKDETAARQLHISVRTLRRHMAELSQRLGASSRFQAGVLALQRGWL